VFNTDLSPPKTRLFNCHRHLDNGLWLDDGTSAADIETIGRLETHPWIVDQLNDGGQYSPVEDEKRAHVNVEDTLRWREWRGD
jgi:hypothetical protein